MRRLKRWSLALSARIHDMVSELENHEALADGAIRHVQAAAARAEVQLTRVTRDGHALRERIQSERRSAELWSERAVAIAASDEAGALECLRRRRRALADGRVLEERLRQHTRLEEQLTADVRAVHERLDRLRHQRNQLRTRASTAEALRASAARGETFGDDLREVFERWEIDVTEVERASPRDDRDTSAADFERTDDTASLRAELAALLQEPDSRNPKPLCIGDLPTVAKGDSQ